MPYSRDEVVTELTSFYELLVSMYLPEDAIKRPPAGGWPQITSDRLGFLNKDETVMELLRHIPYLRRGADRDPLMVYEGCTPNDYSDEEFIEKEHIYIEPCNDPPRKESTARRQSYIATLARTWPPTAGFYIFCDTRTGTLELIDMVVEQGRKRHAKEFFEMLKSEFRTLSVIPMNPREIGAMDGAMSEQMVQLKEIYYKHGWLSKWFRKEECANEVQALWDSFFQISKVVVEVNFHVVDLTA